VIGLLASKLSAQPALVILLAGGTSGTLAYLVAIWFLEKHLP